MLLTTGNLLYGVRKSGDELWRGFVSEAVLEAQLPMLIFSTGVEPSVEIDDGGEEGPTADLLNLPAVELLCVDHSGGEY